MLTIKINYQWILFDADNTLLRFDALGALRLMFFRLGIKFTKQDYRIYTMINHSLWMDYLNGLISAEQMQYARLSPWAKKLSLAPEKLNSLFIATMSELCTPLEGAKNLLNTLHGKVKLGMITNGFTQLQNLRLQQTGLEKYFEFILISEQVGVAKPELGIFEQALSHMNYPERDQVLMVGDSLEFDIGGALNAGFHSCWLNMNGKSIRKGIMPTYQVSSLLALEHLLLKLGVGL